MEEANKRRCWMCGAEIQARHLGSVKVEDSDVAIGYCERCNAFGVPIGEDEKTYRERMAEAKRRVPKGWSMRQCEDGSLELRRGVPCFSFKCVTNVAGGGSMTGQYEENRGRCLSVLREAMAILAG